MINGAIAMGLNIVLNIVLVKYMKHAGLAFATSISALICIVLLFRSLKRKMGYYGQDKIKSVFVKSFVSSAIMGVATFVAYGIMLKIVEMTFIGQVLSLGVSVLVGVIVYAICVISFKVEEVMYLIDIVKSKLNKKNEEKVLN